MDIYEKLKMKYGNIEEYCTESGDWEDRAVEAFKEGDYSTVIENFERVIVAIPDHYNAYEICSYALYKNNEQKKAMDYLEKGIETAKSYEGEAKLPEEMIEDMEKSLRRMKSGEKLDELYLGEIMD